MHYKNSLLKLKTKFFIYFLIFEDIRTGNMWTPFIESKTNHLSSLDEGHLSELSADKEFELLFIKISLPKFWSSTQKDYPTLSENAFKKLLFNYIFN